MQKWQIRNITYLSHGEGKHEKWMLFEIYLQTPHLGHLYQVIED